MTTETHDPDRDAPPSDTPPSDNPPSEGVPSNPPAGEAGDSPALEVDEAHLSLVAGALAYARSLAAKCASLATPNSPVAVHRIEAVAAGDRLELGGGTVYEYAHYVIAKGPGKSGPSISVVATSVPDLSAALGSRYSITKLGPSEMAVALPNEPAAASAIRAPLAALVEEVTGDTPVRQLADEMVASPGVGEGQGDPPGSEPAASFDVDSLRSFLIKTKDPA